MSHATPPRPGLRPLFALGLLAALAAGCEKAPLAPTVPVSAIVITPAVDTVSVGGSAQFTATIYDTLGQVTRGVTVVWRSGDTQIFTVNSVGRIQGTGEGTAMLVASAGGQSDTAQVSVLTGGGWFTQASAVSANLNGVFFLSDGRTGWVVGDGGAIRHTTDAGAHWSLQTSSTTVNLNGVWFTTPVEGWVVGDGGTVLATQDAGSHWTRAVNVPYVDNLRDVHFATPDTGWVAGASGLLLTTFDSGGSWQGFRVPTTFALNGVSFAGTRDGWAVGNGGVIAGTHDRGLTWFLVQPAPTIQSLNAVWRRSEAAAFAVGDQGVTPRTRSTPDSTSWELRNAGASRQLEGVCYPTDLIGYAVGYDASLGGAVLRTDDAGVTWEVQPSHTASRLNDVFFVDALRGWAVGQAGTIIHTANGGRP
jgi:photosystem II stability/assembly factor-like uncharacterized protein